MLQGKNLDLLLIGLIVQYNVLDTITGSINLI